MTGRPETAPSPNSCSWTLRQWTSLCEALEMSCPLCHQRKPRRQCPALGQTICAVCCGTKRLVEIDCPHDCPHLAAAREHPAAVVKRQQASDVATLFPIIRNLSERQLQLFSFLHDVMARHVPDGFTKLVDDDVAEAAGALAATLETASRGIVYEHTPPSLPAQRLAADIRAALEELRKRGQRIYDHEAAVTLRAVERGAREAGRSAGEGGGYLGLVARLMQTSRAPAGGEERVERDPASAIILP